MLHDRSLASRRPPTRMTEYHDLDDDDLVRAVPRDPEAFGTLYDRYAERIHGYCFLRLRNREAAEDATSQVFLKALGGLTSYHGGCFAAWLFRIAHNVVVTAYRQHRPHQPLEAGDDAIDPALGPDDWAFWRAERDELYEAIERLPNDQRTVLELQLAGWTGSQIADVLGKSVPAVKMLRYRAVERLRDVLDDSATIQQEQSNA